MTTVDHHDPLHDTENWFRLVQLFEVLHLFLAQLHIDRGCPKIPSAVSRRARRRHVPMRSLSFSSDVVPMIGALTGSFADIHASETCAIDTPRFFAISSIRGTTASVLAAYALAQLLEANSHCYEGLCIEDSKRELDELVCFSSPSGSPDWARGDSAGEGRPGDRADTEVLQLVVSTRVSRGGKRRTLSVGIISRSSSR